MKHRFYLIALVALLLTGCSARKSHNTLPSWNDTPVKQALMHFLNVEVNKIPIESRIAVFDMDGTLICEKPFGIETVVSIHRLLDLGEKDATVQESIEYQFAKKLSINPQDTSVLNHCYENGQNYFENIILKPFDSADCENYIQYAQHCLNTHINKDYNLKYADMVYQPMLELVDALKEKQFQIYVVSGSMQGIVWSICPQIIGLDRQHLLGIRHDKKVSFSKEGALSYTIKPKMMKPVNNYEGKVVNIYNHIGKTPVIAIGNTYSDFGLFHMVSCSPYPHLALMLNHDDSVREYSYPPYYGKDLNWQDTLRLHNWLQADMTREFKTVWKIQQK